MPREKGIPIGNLTSQIFANIYLNELDIFVRQKLKIKNYLRYGDDFLIFDENLSVIGANKIKINKFIKNLLKMNTNRNCYMGQVKDGIKFCGVEIFFNGKRLNRRMRKRSLRRLSFRNAASYQALFSWHDKKLLSVANWQLLLLLENQ